jgi:hypothetical protein
MVMWEGGLGRSHELGEGSRKRKETEAADGDVVGEVQLRHFIAYTVQALSD